jgi:S-DNA-T family DNA segregation ATPase FtsK/SpoIIIE
VNNTVFQHNLQASAGCAEAIIPLGQGAFRLSTTTTPKPTDDAPRRPFRVRRLFAFGLSVMLFLAIWPWGSYDPRDIDRLTGGIPDTEMISNCFGYLGAWVSWGVLLTFGLAAYPMALLLLLSSTRRLFSGRKLRPAGWDYWVALGLFLLGFCMLLGIWPDFLSAFTERLNLQSLPGGALGQRLSSTGEDYQGWLRFFLNPTGTAIVSILLIGAATAILWVHDWHGLLVPYLFRPKGERDEDDGRLRKRSVEPTQPARRVEREPRERGQRSLMDDELPAVPAPAAPVMPAPPKPKEAPAASKSAPRKKGSSGKAGKDGSYTLPSIELLLPDQGAMSAVDPKEVQRKTEVLQETLENFNIDAQVVKSTSGPRVTLFEVLPAPGVRVERISNISNNIAMELRAISLRILTPIPGKNTVGIEVPNEKAALVTMRDLVQNSAWQSPKADIPVLIGRNIAGEVVVSDLAKAPHLLIAGATGSGKSVCINLLIMSLLYRFSPEELRMILVDPKVVEFACYESLPHLIVPVISDVNKVPLALRWVIREMKHRYDIMAKVNSRNITVFNRRKPSPEPVYDDDGNPIPDRLPYIVVVIDELADIMMTAKADVETSLARIAQLSRAVGIHTIIATQRPSVNIITGVIKANFPTRIAFKVTSQVDSRTIIDGKGAEALLGQGDMLFKPPGAGTMERNQGALVRDEEIERVVSFCSEQAEQDFDEEVFKGSEGEEGVVGDGGFGELSDGDEALVQQAIDVIRRDRRATTSYVQRALRIGYNRAAMVMEILEERGIIGPQIGQMPREILAIDDVLDDDMDDERVDDADDDGTDNT